MLKVSDYQHILLNEEDGVAIITMNRPEKRNALSLELMEELTAAFRAIGLDRSQRAVVLRGNGPAFSAGHDLREMLQREVDDHRRTFDACVVLMETIQGIPQPVIAQVAGIATAAGCQLVATCDLAVASREARFATPGVKIGLFCTTPMVALTRAIGRKHAMEMLLTGEFVSARTAADWGLINAVVDEAQLDEAAMTMARKVVASSKFVVGLGKAAFYAQVDLDQPKAYAYAKEVMSMNALAEDAQEGMSAFVEKRAPQWKS